jgi:sensor histidine kinase YesM
MSGDLTFPAAPGDEHYLRRVVRAFDRRRIGAVGLVTLLLSAGPLSGVDLDFFSPAEMALLWLEQFLELAVLAAVLTIAYTLLTEAMSRQPRGLRLAISCSMLFGLSVVLTLVLFGYYAHGFEHLPTLPRLLSDSLRFGLPAVFLVLIADVHRRALQIDSAAHAAEISRLQLGHDEAEQQLALLQAQIEPHFLFNVLGNVRRLYRTQPQAGSETIISLMRYLRAALPQLRTQSTSLSGELELVRAYLDLLKVRMAERLTFSIETDPTLDDLQFPPMLLITLVENAIKHGLDPVGGGSVRVIARAQPDMLEVAVLDDGAGLGAAASGGTGVGLVNVRRQLAARYQTQARLTLEARTPRGTIATIWIPIRVPAGGVERNWRRQTA